MSTAPKKVTGETVTVICKIPQGILLQLHKEEKFNEVTMGGSREVMRFRPVGEPVHINGPAHGQNEGPRVAMSKSFAITENVSKDFWDKWMKETGQYLPATKNGLLVAAPNISQAKDIAKENQKERTGLERLDPNNLPTTDKRFKLETATEQKAEIGHVEQ